jgi:hypothetical protein
MGSTPAARGSGQLRAQDAFSPPAAVRRSPLSVSCPVSSSKLVFISVRTWRATGASSCHGLLEMGLLVPSTGGAAVCTVAKILKMAD